MANLESRLKAKNLATHRNRRKIQRPLNQQGGHLKVSDYFGENVFDFRTAPGIPEDIRKELIEVSRSHKKLNKQHVEVVAKLVLEWAAQKGATHFCHWFQPLTGATAEKHDAFLGFTKDDRPIESLSSGQLMQGEPDASSFPNGGSRSTFEARGYTSWDLSSPLFIREGENGKTLCIPTAFVSYNGEALDIKTPLLRSISKLDTVATEFLNAIGENDVEWVHATCGAEQEYFLVDKAFYFARPDLVMSGRTLFGSLTSKNQQLDDHYFGIVPERILAFMQELDLELHRLGIPAKTRHNEVAPGQFEIAPIFRDANLSADQNQIVMASIKSTAQKHDLVALLHEKPFAGVNGSGKHLNWSMADSKGTNLLEPGKNPHENYRFLAMVAIIVEAVHRHGAALRMSISGHGNDHRLGANEAPPSIISVFLGDTLERIYGALCEGATFTPDKTTILDIGADQLAHLLKDNTDRNRTSPFAFTGNRFEFRAVGSDQSIGFPLSILNTAVSEVIEEATEEIKKLTASGNSVDDSLLQIIKKYIGQSKNVIFNGDGYGQDWVEEAEKRGLPNLKNTADALDVLRDSSKTAFLTEAGVYRENELQTRYNVLVERYNLCRKIEFSTLIGLVQQNVLPAGIDYKLKLGQVIKDQKEIGFESYVEREKYKTISATMESLYDAMKNLENSMNELPEDEAQVSKTIANDLLPLANDIAKHCNDLEEVVPDSLWALPKYYDMLFLR